MTKKEENTLEDVAALLRDTADALETACEEASMAAEDAGGFPGDAKLPTKAIRKVQKECGKAHAKLGKLLDT